MNRLLMLPLLVVLLGGADAPKLDSQPKPLTPAPAPAPSVGSVIVPPDAKAALVDQIWACGVSKGACIQALQTLDKYTVQPASTAGTKSPQ